ncbi:hypothetical protein P5673_004605 [Acropora cervicornis]|uniref:Uncharacterized protein n=1 Tax=Acropora cervicornis TaxID=6130 RepID=A0AAD9R102_ACRCE|nr:hypothetical protein P5673_004605 [Acropora cervicornis]
MEEEAHKQINGTIITTEDFVTIFTQRNDVFPSASRRVDEFELAVIKVCAKEDPPSVNFCTQQEMLTAKFKVLKAKGLVSISLLVTIARKMRRIIIKSVITFMSSENEKGRIYTQLPFGEELRAFKYGDFSRKLFQKRIKTVKLVEVIDEDDIR